MLSELKHPAAQLPGLAELVEAYAAAYRRAADEEKVQLNETLSAILAALGESVSFRESRHRAFDWVSKMAAAVAERRFYANERPPGATAELCRELAEEAEARFAAAVEKPTSWYSDVGELPWSRLLANPAFVAWICGHVGIHPEQLHRSVAMGYLYYRREGNRFAAHIDNPRTHAINCIICLEHVVPDRGAPSVLRVLDPDHGWRDAALAPGEAVLFNADSTVHARTPLGPGESVTLLSIGMNWS
jgi:hypothetical protein